MPCRAVSPQVGLFLTPDLSHFPSPGPGIPRCATDRHRGHRELAAWKLQRYKKHMCLCGLLNCHLLSISSLRPAAQGSAVHSSPSSLTFSTAEREGRGLQGGVPESGWKNPRSLQDARCWPGKLRDAPASCPGSPPQSSTSRGGGLAPCGWQLWGAPAYTSPALLWGKAGTSSCTGAGYWCLVCVGCPSPGRESSPDASHCPLGEMLRQRTKLVCPR